MEFGAVPIDAYDAADAMGSPAVSCIGSSRLAALVDADSSP